MRGGAYELSMVRCARKSSRCSMSALCVPSCTALHGPISTVLHGPVCTVLHDPIGTAVRPPTAPRSIVEAARGFVVPSALRCRVKPHRGSSSTLHQGFWSLRRCRSHTGQGRPVVLPLEKQPPHGGVSSQQQDQQVEEVSPRNVLGMAIHLRAGQWKRRFDPAELLPAGGRGEPGGSDGHRAQRGKDRDRGKLAPLRRRG